MNGSEDPFRIAIRLSRQLPPRIPYGLDVPEYLFLAVIPENLDTIISDGGIRPTRFMTRLYRTLFRAYELRGFYQNPLVFRIDMNGMRSRSGLIIPSEEDFLVDGIIPLDCLERLPGDDILHMMYMTEDEFEEVIVSERHIVLCIRDGANRLVQTGDSVIFVEKGSMHECGAVVTDVRSFRSFTEAYDAYTPTELGYSDDEIPSPMDIILEYPYDEQVRYGVMAISVTVSWTETSVKRFLSDSI